MKKQLKSDIQSYRSEQLLRKIMINRKAEGRRLTIEILLACKLESSSNGTNDQQERIIKI